MKKINKGTPWLYFILSQITGGVFVFYWIVDLMRAVNSLGETPRFNLKVYEVLFGVGLLVQLSALAISIATFNTGGSSNGVAVVVLFSFSVLLLSIMLYALIKINKELTVIEGRSFGFLGVISTIVLFFLLFYIGFHLQARINALKNRRV